LDGSGHGSISAYRATRQAGFHGPATTPSASSGWGALTGGAATRPPRPRATLSARRGSRAADGRAVGLMAIKFEVAHLVAARLGQRAGAAVRRRRRPATAGWPGSGQGSRAGSPG